MCSNRRHQLLLVALLFLGVGPLLLADAVIATPVGGDPALAARQVYAYTCEHQPASEAVTLVRPLLSPRGSVELQPGNNSLVVRDTREAIERIKPVLESFDHPPQSLRLDIRIVRAGPAKGARPSGMPDATALPGDLAARLGGLLRYDSYEKLAETTVTPTEGEEVTYAIGKDYSVSFRLGTVLAGQRLRLHDFRILQRARNPANKSRQLPPRKLLHTNLNLWLDQQLALVVPQDTGAADEALMVAIACRWDE